MSALADRETQRTHSARRALSFLVYRVLVLAYGGVAVALPSPTAEPYLVKDINPGTVAGVEHEPTQLTAVGERLYFTYPDSMYGLELWTSDGTTAGTRVVADVCPGECGADPIRLTAAGQRLFFVADDGRSGKELWVSDGPASASLVKDIFPGSRGSSPFSLTAAGQQLFFIADDGQSGEELWVSNGEHEGTRLLKDIRPGAVSSELIFLGVIGERLFFSVSGVELWASDGTPEGTQLLKDELVQFGRPGGVPHFRDVPVKIGERVFFSANDDATGVELWVSDGTPEGTSIVKDINAGPESSDPNELTVAGEQIFFVTDTDWDSVDGRLWVSDGTGQGTQLIKEIIIDAFFTNVVAAGERVFFWGDGNNELWVSSGTTAGTRRVYRGTDGFDGDELVTAGGYAYFSDDNSERIWVTDGTPAGTRMLSEDFPGIGTTWLLGTKLLLLRSGRLWVASPEQVLDLGLTVSLPQGLVVMRDGSVLISNSGLYVSDGTLAGTLLVHPRFSSTVGPLTRVGDRVFFTVSRELWVSDGKPGGAGTRLVKEMEMPSPVPADSSPEVVRATEERVFFSATSEGDRGLWASDGKSEGTWLINSQPPLRAATVGDHVFFSCRDGLWLSGGTPETTWRVGDTWIARVDRRAFFGGAGGLWASDGTPEGTSLLRETPVVQSVVAADDRTFFFAGGSPRELWVSDGTTAGTRFLMDTRSTRSIAVGDRLFFEAFSSHSVQLWMSDGTSSRMVVEFEDSEDCVLYGRDCPSITPFVATGERLFFRFRERTRSEIWASDGTSGGSHLIMRTSGFSLAAVLGERVFFNSGGNFWVSDGTPIGTVQLGELSAASSTVLGDRVFFTSVGALWVSDGTSGGTVRLGGWRASSLLALGDQLFFTDTDASRGRELWVSNGTPEGTRLFKDIRPGPEGSYPGKLRVQGEKLYFAASDGLSGEELWVSDGTAEGTYRLADVRPGAEGSMPAEFTVVGDRLFFAARDGVHGVELWAMPTDGATRFLRGDCNGDRGVGIADAIFSLNRLFGGGRPSSCREACDANGDAGVDTSDAIFLLNHLFAGGPPPVDPGSETCGPDPDPKSSLGCKSPSC